MSLLLTLGGIATVAPLVVGVFRLVAAVVRHVDAVAALTLELSRLVPLVESHETRLSRLEGITHP